MALIYRHAGMELTLNLSHQSNMIHSCELSDHGYLIKIGDTVYKDSLILTPENLEMWAVSQVSDLKYEDFVKFSTLQTEVVLLGTGNTMTFPDMAITQPLMDKGIGLEVMTTAAACRTYNVLLGDGRRVSAALIV